MNWKMYTNELISFVLTHLNGTESNKDDLVGHLTLWCSDSRSHLFLFGSTPEVFKMRLICGLHFIFIAIFIGLLCARSFC